jgi:DedD protein
MDQNLKQRLVGAVVITALAAIFIPMIFDESVSDRGTMISSLTLPDEPAVARDYMANPPEINLPETSYLQANVEEDPRMEDILAGGAVETEVNAPIQTQMDRWFIQVGIFGKEVNAISIRDKIRKQGFPVMVSSLSGVKGTLYRVMVGPELNKMRAEEIKRKMEVLNGLKGILISNAK